ncbi:HGxxPAAW family protein [Streptomyces sp. NPDC090303]|uniref:HGxxPAAW family protein n=1 Tax=Streptomyces sp. NPDC090303 TaxID=3365960 RepID=UPI003828AA31
MSAHGHVDLGHTVAGWTGTATGLLSLSVLGLSVITVSPPLALTGAGLGVLAVLVTWWLHLAGWGKPTGPRPESAWSWRAKDRTARRGHPDCLGCRMAGRKPQPRPAASAVEVRGTAAPATEPRHGSRTPTPAQGV